MKIGINYLKKNLNLEKLLQLLDRKQDYETDQDFITESVLVSSGVNQEEIPDLAERSFWRSQAETNSSLQSDREEMWYSLQINSRNGDLLTKVSNNFEKIKSWSQSLKYRDVNIICTYSKKNKKYYLVVSEYDESTPSPCAVYIAYSSHDKKKNINEMEKLIKKATKLQTLHDW